MYGVKVASDNAVIKDCRFTSIEPGYGIFVDGADCEIESDSLWEVEYGIYCYNASPTLEGVKVTERGHDGIAVEGVGSEPIYLHNVSITGTYTNSMLYAGSTNMLIENCSFISSDAERTPTGIVGSITDSMKIRDTKIEEFSREGFYFYLCQGARWDLGVDSLDPGGNTITTSYGDDKWFYMTGSVYTDDIEAQCNYWGDCPPDHNLFDTSPRGVDYDNCLASAPKRVVSGHDETKAGLPISFDISQNYPNPFNPTTLIEYSVPVSSPVKLEIYNVLGQKVRTLVDQFEVAGRYRVSWDGTNQANQDVASGVYLYKLTAGTQTITKKMLMLK